MNAAKSPARPAGGEAAGRGAGRRAWHCALSVIVHNEVAEFAKQEHFNKVRRNLRNIMCEYVCIDVCSGDD